MDRNPDTPKAPLDPKETERAYALLSLIPYMDPKDAEKARATVRLILLGEHPPIPFLSRFHK